MIFIGFVFHIDKVQEDEFFYLFNVKATFRWLYPRPVKFYKKVFYKSKNIILKY